ncbi:GrpB family protein [Metabacillus hrfriensis]|uniref:GrpB family protein n=1 Tax=Metabacillus hrfriensis TaxID=3048891 RepID=A0ACD4REP0_9BACI|nr:GrpB family protein [Metabacillus sp. CT-WN-B3]WHZ58971.1 GrpB family protein [Metabacillus sp. CT-WN-B3]
MSYSSIEIIQYDEQWITNFKSIKQVISKSLCDLIIDIEHVGSTSIQGLAAKPILDIDIVIENYDVFPNVIQGLEKIGYLHQEEWSFEGREAFGRIDTLTPWDGKGTQWMEHHLYVCDKDSEELLRHLAFRDYLRNNREAVIEYENLKRKLANTVKDRNSFSLGKTEFINGILKKVLG